MRVSRVAVLVIPVAVLSGRACGQSDFRGLYHATSLRTYATAVSADGNTAVGYAESVLFAFRWTEATGLSLMTFPPGVTTANASGVSANGSVIVGVAESSSLLHGFRWTAATGPVDLGALPGPGNFVVANGVSGDGSVVVGHSVKTGGQLVAFRWTAAGMTELVAPGTGSSAASVSADGSVIVGHASSQLGTWAVSWIGSLPGQPLPTLPGTGMSAAYAISANGTVIVGANTLDSQPHPVRWTSSGVEELELLPGTIGGYALAVSGDGSVVVGHMTVPGVGQLAFIWDAVHGSRLLTDALARDASLGSQVCGWTLKTATGISADGKTIVGNGRNPQGNDEAWIATIGQVGFCYANCDSSTAPPILNAMDLQCFLNRFAGAECAANCDGSTAPPTLNINDFQCFINAFAAGCP